MAYLRLTDAAIEDLNHIFRRDPSILRIVFTKLLLLEKNPKAGEPLLSDLIGWRKLTVGNRHWRIIWRIQTDVHGEIEIEIAQVWAIGARSDSQIYNEMKERIASVSPSPNATAISEVFALFGEKFGEKFGESTSLVEPKDHPAPPWLLERLEHSAGMRKEQVRGLSVNQAMEIWEDFIRKEKD